jgi:hypothetical protein
MSRQSAAGSCEALGFCQTKAENTDDSNVVDKKFVADVRTDADTCDNCVKLVEAMKDDQQEVSGRYELNRET